jgi:hypothetical protein
MQDKLDLEEAKIAEFQKKLKSLNRQLTAAYNRRDKILVDMNEGNFGSMEWLIKNPTMPGSSEALDNKFKELYGGNYSGVYPDGYTHDNYKPIQKNFSFVLGYSDKEKRIANCKHFVDNYMQFMVPFDETQSRWTKEFPTKKVIGFQFKATEDGLHNLGYDPEEGVWYYYTTTYGKNDTEKVFANFDDAIEFAYELANEEEEND